MIPARAGSALLLVATVLAAPPAPAAARPSLLLTGAAEPTTVPVGDDLSFVMMVANQGTQTAAGVEVRVTLPPGAVLASASSAAGDCAGSAPMVCPIGDLPPGGSSSVHVLATAIAGPTLVVEAEASAKPSGEVPPPEAAHATPTARVTGRSCDVVGTQHEDVLAGAGVVCGLRGDDEIASGAGRDRILGGSGDDLLRGAAGHDLLDGGDGQDAAAFGRTVLADLRSGRAEGEGRDRLVRLEGAIGSPGDDVLLGSDRADRLDGGAGSDTLAGRWGRDRLDGGAGRDACDPGPAAAPPGSCEVRSFARDPTISLFQLSRGTVGYGYHQSLFGAARPLTPVPSGDPSVVMSSRGRGTGATTAVDVVVPPGSAVLAPVSGRVVAVQRFHLYCAFLDWKLVIRPAERPDLRVMVLHLGTTRVAEGSRVSAGATVIGTAAASDLASSQVNRYFPERYSHVHVEIERGYAPTPGCSV